ncbi:hypothetical protein CDIK_4320 [Cucumispora dikerogammari]|nr:hypothetical protein CDIK_4320 [Cucumispora dikerogammari]
MNADSIKKKRITLSLELIKLIRSQINTGKSNKEISETTNTSVSSIRCISKKILDGLSDGEIIIKKGRKYVSNIETQTHLCAIVQSDNALTQRGISNVLAEAGLSKSQPTISRMLKKANITRKRLTLVPAERNSPRILDLRYNYAIEMNVISLDRFVFLDETGFNLHTSQSYGYSPKNTKSFSTVKANRGVNQSLMCAIDKNGVIGYKIISGAFDGSEFKVFIENNLLEYFRTHRSYILVMDNCRFHHRQDVLRLLNENRILYKFLPPYSPQLNPIEEFFSYLKSGYKSFRPRPKSISDIKNLVQELMEENRDYPLAAYFARMKEFCLLGSTRQPFI